MLKKNIKIIIKIIIILLIFQMFSIPRVKASNNWDDIISEGQNFINKGKSESSGNKAIIEKDEINKINSNIYNILLSLGIVISVIIGAILGIQIMWGSIEQQVKAKEMLIPYVVGCVVVFGTFGIWKIAVTIFSKL